MADTFEHEALPDKVRRQIEKAHLPTAGAIAFQPRLVTKQGRVLIGTAEITIGPKAGKVEESIRKEGSGFATARMEVRPIIGT